jgi:hypothetical protein
MPVIGLYTFVLSRKFPTYMNPPTMAGWLWHLLVKREQDAWNVFVEKIKELRMDYTPHFTASTTEFHRQVEKDSALIFARFKDLEVPYPSPQEFRNRSAPNKDVFRIVTQAGTIS